MNNHPKPPSETGAGLVERAKELAGSLVVPAPVKGFVMQAYMVVAGPAANFLAGRWSENGFREFYLLGMAIKSDPAETCLLAIGLVAAIASISRAMFRKEDDPVGWKSETVVASSVALALFVVLSLGRKQWGVRYAMPLFPIFGALAIMALWRRRFGRSAATLLVAAHAGFLIAAPPGLLSYFNPALGGRKAGDRWLSGVDYDWGQGLKELVEWYQREGDGRPVFYEGMGDLRSYALVAPPLAKYEPSQHRRALLLVSKYRLRDPEGLREFLDIVPMATPSEITAVYDLTRPDAAVAAEAHRARLAEKKRK
jgi:hypothetical protein